MNLAQGLLRTATTALLILAGTVHAQTRVTVPTLRSTGAGITYSSSDGLAVKQDPTFTVVFPNGAAEFASTFHGRISGLTPATGPIPPWVNDSSTSLWIGPRGGGVGVAPGSYRYLSSFNLTGFDPATVRITGRVAADNRVTNLRINGFETGFTTASDSSFESWTPLTIDAATFPRFNQGTNSIEIVVNNSGATASPAGLRMEITASAVAYEGTRSIAGFWDMQGSATVPLQPASDAPLEFSADTPSGSGTSLRLAPAKTYARITDAARSMVPSLDSTLAAWVKPLANASSPLGEILFSYGGGGGYKLWLGSGRRLAFTVYGVQDIYSDITFPTDNQWHHVAAVHRSGSGVTFYLDGVPRDFKAYSGGHRVTANNQLLFGYEGDFTLPFNGLLDDVVIASSALPVHQFMPSPAPNLALMGRRTPDSTALLGTTAAGSAGRVVAAAGDVDGDGFDDLLVSAPIAGGSGAVWLLSGPVSGVVNVSNATIHLTGLASGDEAGSSLAAGGDQDRDGYGDFWVGAPGANVVYGLRGSAGGTTPLSQAPVVLKGASSGDNFGDAVVGNVDLDGDGRWELAVAAPDGKSNHAGSGVVYIYRQPGAGTWSPSAAALTIPGEAVGDGLGESLVGIPDVNGDGQDELAVGATAHQIGVGEVGTAYLLYGNNLL
jgi:hypothetical protein